MFAIYIFIILCSVIIIAFTIQLLTNIYNVNRTNISYLPSKILFLTILVSLILLAIFSKELNIKYLILNSIYIAFLILIANIDADSKIIPNKIVIIGTILSVIIFTFNTDSIQDNSKSLILESLAGLSIGFGIMLIFYLLPFTRIGAGDVKLSALIGAISGFPKIFFALSSGIIFVGIISIFLVLSKRKSINEDIAFGPYLCAGTAFIIILEDNLSNIIPTLY